MELTRTVTIIACCFQLLMCVTGAPSPQEPIFELPVQLVGFPVIIAAVRISNFVKKLAYSLSPETYGSRTKRGEPRLADGKILDVENELMTEFGNDVCIYERICAEYAGITSPKRDRRQELDWDVIFSQYESSPDPMKENYLLSVFMGDVFGSPRLCHQLAKRQRACLRSTPSE